MIRATLIGGPLDGKEVDVRDHRDVIQPTGGSFDIVGRKLGGPISHIAAPRGDYFCDLAALAEGSYRWVWQPAQPLPE